MRSNCDHGSYASSAFSSSCSVSDTKNLTSERVKEYVTSPGDFKALVGFAGTVIILIDEHKKWDWLEHGVKKRLMEELKKIDVTLNLEKTRVVDLNRGDSFCFLEFKFIRTRTKLGKRSVAQISKMEARTNLLRKLKVIFGQHRSQPIEKVVNLINPILRGWVNYFRVGNSSRCFEYIKHWVDKKIRRHFMRARKIDGFGWKKRSIQRMYQKLGLYVDYKVRYCETWKV